MLIWVNRMWIILLLGASPAAFSVEQPPKIVTIGPLDFASTLPPDKSAKAVHVAQFQLDVVPVSNERFLQFVNTHPQWRRNEIGGLFADRGYLSHWQSPTSLATEQSQQPVIWVSWFAATAYCETLDGRLPRWYEWEAAAAAGVSVPDARSDPQWRQQILNWYARSSTAERLPNVGASPANYYGVKDLHGVIWEWVEDYNGMLVGADSREQNGANTLAFCGAGAIDMEQKENYATLMRIALLSSMQARYTTRNLGFRCAYDTH